MNARTLAWRVSPRDASASRQRQIADDAHAAAQEINRSLKTVLGNMALVLTWLDPDSEAHARMSRALDEAKRIRQVVSDMEHIRLQEADPPTDLANGRGRHRAWRTARRTLGLALVRSGERFWPSPKV